MKKITVTHLDDGQWFGLTEDGDFLTLERVPKGTSSGDIIDLEEEYLRREPLQNAKHAKRNKYFSNRHLSIAAAILLVFASSFFSFFSNSAEASMITFYGDTEWSIEIREDGSLFDVSTGEQLDISNTAYIHEKLSSIGNDQHKIWAGIENNDKNPHVANVMDRIKGDLEDKELTVYSFSFNQKWWEIKREENLSMKELFQLYIKDEYQVDANADNVDMWMEELQKKHDVFQ
jgi:hypothetical protein